MYLLGMGSSEISRYRGELRQRMSHCRSDNQREKKICRMPLSHTCKYICSDTVFFSMRGCRPLSYQLISSNTLWKRTVRMPIASSLIEQKRILSGKRFLTFSHYFYLCFHYFSFFFFFFVYYSYCHSKFFCLS